MQHDQPQAAQAAQVAHAAVDPLLLFFLVFALTGTAGLAALLRSGKSLSPRNILTWVLNSGLMGIGLFWFWQRAYGPDLWGLFGICILIGLGGLPAVEAVQNMARQGISKISINTGGTRENPPKPPTPEQKDS